MLYYLSQWILEAARGQTWVEYVSALRLFRYITFRTAGAAVTAMLLSFWLGPRIIRWLRTGFGQNYQDRADETAQFDTRILKKQGVPTAGGLLIVVTMSISTLLWAQWNELTELTLLSLIVLAGLGFYDDYAKLAKGNARGASSSVKLTVQTILAGFIGLYLWLSPSMHKLGLVSDIMVPFYKFPVLTGVAVVGVVVTMLAIVGSSNAVNLTDGLDGLAIGCTLIVTVVFLVMSYAAGNARVAIYLSVPYVPGAGELTVFCAAMLGAGMGFLWFNCHPAQVFMGDTGSLALGGALGIVAVLIHQPFVLLIAGGVFVMEAASVLIQTGYFKWTRLCTGTGRRVFLMAPIHHHFEKKGWYETQVVTRFYILSVLFAVVALSTLKIR
jgi:phospho-N-acetylmuramoyl-pentapeptide-transferase